VKKRQDFSSLHRFIRRPERAFLTLSLIFGMMFIIALPPFQSPDEPAHFYRAYQLSEGKIIADTLPKQKSYQSGGSLPLSIIRTATLWCDRIPFKLSQKVKREQFSESLNMPLEREKTAYTIFASALYSPIPYLPQTVGIAVGKLFNLAPLWLMYLGRFANLITATLITFFSIRIVPFYKWVFFLLALTPMAIAQSASLSADVVLNGTAFLLSAGLINCAFNSKKDKLTAKDIALISVAGMVVSLSKSAYLPLVLLFCLIPKRKFNSLKDYLISALFVILPSVLAWFLWNLAVKGLGVPVNIQIGASPEQQVAYLSAHPLMVFTLAWDTLRGLDYMIGTFIGVLGWLDTRLPLITLISYAAMLIWVALVSGEPDYNVPGSSKLKIAFVLTAIVFSIYLLMYLLWSPVGEKSVLGVQGRYFIATSPLFFLLLYNQRFSSKIPERRFHSLILYYSMFALVSSLIAVIFRYYIPT